MGLRRRREDIHNWSDDILAVITSSSQRCEWRNNEAACRRITQCAAAAALWELAAAENVSRREEQAKEENYLAGSEKCRAKLTLAELFYNPLVFSIHDPNLP